MHSVFAATLFAPLIHARHDLGSFGALDNAVDMHSFLRFAALNSLGGALYALRVPERWYPGIFDMFGHSHNWMHLLVVAGAMDRLHGLAKLHDAVQHKQA